MIGWRPQPGEKIVVSDSIESLHDPRITNFIVIFIKYNPPDHKFPIHTHMIGDKNLITNWKYCAKYEEKPKNKLLKHYL